MGAGRGVVVMGWIVLTVYLLGWLSTWLLASKRAHRTGLFNGEVVDNVVITGLASVLWPLVLVGMVVAWWITRPESVPEHDAPKPPTRGAYR